MTAADFVRRTLEGERVGISIELLPDVFEAFKKEVKDAEEVQAKCMALLEEIRMSPHCAIPPKYNEAIIQILNGKV